MFSTAVSAMPFGLRGRGVAGVGVSAGSSSRGGGGSQKDNCRPEGLDRFFVMSLSIGRVVRPWIDSTTVL